MLKQLLISLLVLIVAVLGYVYFVPGGDATLKGVGINLPFPTSYPATQVAAAGAPAGGGRRGGNRAQMQTVITSPVGTTTINDKLSAIGQGTADQSVSVTTQATGTLVTLSVAPGDKVKAGQVIGQLDADSEQIAYDKATLAAKDAADTLARTKTLVKSNNATAVALSVAQLAADNTNLELRDAKVALDKRAVVTPINGTVGLFQVTPGNAVGVQTVVTTVDDTSSILVNYWVPERYASSIAIGQPVTAMAVALPGRAFTGKVSAVDSRVDPTSRTLEVQAMVPNTDNAIKPGMSFDVAMTFSGDKYPSVDPLAIQWGSDGSYVWQFTADSKVKRNLVQIIERNSDGVLVKGNLKPGDQVVTQGVLQLADGVTVRRLDSGATADAGAAAPDANASALKTVASVATTSP